MCIMVDLNIVMGLVSLGCVIVWTIVVNWQIPDKWLAEENEDSDADSQTESVYDDDELNNPYLPPP